MLIKHLLVTITLLLISTGIVSGQEKQKIEVDSKGQLVLSPELQEKARRREGLTKNPDFIKLQIVADSAEQDDGAAKLIGPYEVGTQISFKILMTNTLTEPFTTSVSEAYDQTRPQLTFNGRVVPYLEKKSKDLRYKDEFSNVTYGLTISLAPNRPQAIVTINLNEWYKPLEPGLYELTVKFRLRHGGKWIEAPMITFEVVPQ